MHSTSQAFATQSGLMQKSSRQIAEILKANQIALKKQVCSQ